MESKLTSIEELSSEDNEVLFKKIIYFSFLESLAKAAYPKDSVKQRFIKFLSEFSKWQEGNCYCPIHIQKQNLVSSDILDACSLSIQGIYNEGNRNYATIEKFALNNSNFSQNQDQCKFSYLLYHSRNALVHQFQSSNEWTESIERRGVNSPFYEVIERGEEIFLNPTNYHMEIIFPNVFLKKLAKDGLSNFIKYCRKEGINPFLRYYSERKIYEKEII